MGVVIWYNVNMEKVIEKVKKHMTDDQFVFFLVGLFLLMVLAFGIYSQIALRQTQKVLLSEKNNVSSLNTKVSNLDNNLAILIEENQSLNNLLSEEQKRVYDLEREQRRNERDIDELTKLTTIDPELLKKYSKVFFLSDNYAPRELETLSSKYVYPSTKKVEVLSDIEEYLTDMLNDAEDNDEVIIRAASGFRSFSTQKGLKDAYTVQYGAGTANAFSAEQGYSEHQMGTTLDLTTPALNGGLSGFDKTTAYTWLNENAYKYGFVLSYPKDNGYYIYEPWHWRFVGKKLARYLHREEMDFYEMDQRDIDEYLVDIFD